MGTEPSTQRGSCRPWYFAPLSTATAQPQEPPGQRNSLSLPWRQEQGRHGPPQGHIGQQFCTKRGPGPFPGMNEVCSGQPSRLARSLAIQLAGAQQLGGGPAQSWCLEHHVPAQLPQGPWRLRCTEHTRLHRAGGLQAPKSPFTAGCIPPAKGQPASRPELPAPPGPCRDRQGLEAAQGSLSGKELHQGCLSWGPRPGLAWAGQGAVPPGRAGVAAAMLPPFCLGNWVKNR